MIDPIKGGEESKPMGSPRISTRGQRPRLLFNYGSSIMNIACKAYQRLESFDGPIGSLTKAMASMTIPILHPLLLQWLLVLSFVDDKIQIIEDITMSIFPPSSHIFRKMDELALFAESLPSKFDNFIDRLIALLHHCFIHLIPSWTTCEERDIVVDIKCDKQNETSAKLHLHGGDDDDDEQQAKKKVEEEEKRDMERSCSEIIEALDSVASDKEKIDRNKTQEECKERMLNDPIMELFDEGWHLKRFVEEKRKARS
ncbi:uncharacterized protein [Typha latifolia]|uniref:uncharacterized protein n=1 Tax=Typha latifolia TaxID=4733 RepID=UPI003C2CD1C8